MSLSLSRFTLPQMLPLTPQPAPRFGSYDDLRAANNEVLSVVKKEVHALFFSFLLATSMYNFVGMEMDIASFSYQLLTQAKSRGAMGRVGQMANTVAVLLSALSEEQVDQLGQKLAVPMTDLTAYKEGVRSYCPAGWDLKTFEIPAGDKTAALMKIMLFVKSKGLEPQFQAAVKDVLANADLASQALGGVAACQLSDLNRVMA